MARVRIQKHRVGGGSQYDAGYEAGKKEAEAEAARQLESLESTLSARIRTETDTMRRREDLLRRQLKETEEQITTLENALANLQGVTTMEGLKSLNEQKAKMQEEEIAEVGAGHGSRDGQDGIRVTTFLGWPCFELSKYCKLFLGGKDGHGPFEDGKAHGFARSVRDLYEMLMRTGRVGTIVTDPISYRGNVGTFVKGGTARDAAAASQYLDRS